MPGQFVAAVQAIDLRNPVLSADRASLLEFMPERIRFRPIDPQERMDVDLFANHELTKAVIAAIEAAAPAAGTSAAELLDLLRMSSGRSPQEVLAARIVAYRTEVRDSQLSSGVPDGRTTAIDALLAKVIAVSGADRGARIARPARRNGRLRPLPLAVTATARPFPKIASGLDLHRKAESSASLSAMFAILHALGVFVTDLSFSKIPSAGDLATRLSLLCGKQFPVSSRKFPVQLRREFRCNQLTYSRKTEPSSRLRG